MDIIFSFGAGGARGETSQWGPDFWGQDGGGGPWGNIWVQVMADPETESVNIWIFREFMLCFWNKI